MKALTSLLLVALAPGWALAQTTPKPASKPKTVTVAKAPASAASRSTTKKRGSRLAPSARKAVEEVTPVDEDPNIQLTDADREVAKQVFVGSIPCELGATVQLTPMKQEGFFIVTTKGHRFRMHPVESRTGAIRLEDPRHGAMWLQLGNKSMLMSQKLGVRLADECQSPQQVTVADELKRNPRPSILESQSQSPAMVPVTPATAPPAGTQSVLPAAVPATPSATTPPAPTN